MTNNCVNMDDNFISLIVSTWFGYFFKRKARDMDDKKMGKDQLLDM